MSNKSGCGEEDMNETDFMDNYVLAQDSWLIALEGIVALIFGFFVLIWPEMTLEFLIILFGVFAVVGGILAFVAAVKAEKGQRGIRIFGGMVCIAVGLAVLLVPRLTLAMLLIFIVLWMLVLGIFKLIAAFKIPKEMGSKWVFGLEGIFYIVFAVLLVSLGIEGLELLCLLIGFFAIFAGIILITLAFMVRSQQMQVAA